jgi:hypothetical protein
MTAILTAMQRFLARGFIALVLLSLLGCSSRHEGPLVHPGSYKENPEELRRLWLEILTACQKDDRNRLHELMASFVMTEAELSTLFGEAVAHRLWPRYQALLLPMVNIGATELVAHVYEYKYDDIAVSRVDTAPESDQSESDRNILRQLLGPRPVYAVRVKRAKDKSGLRYDFFVYINGYWRSGGLLGKYLPPPP